MRKVKNNNTKAKHELRVFVCKEIEIELDVYMDMHPTVKNRGQAAERILEDHLIINKYHTTESRLGGLIKTLKDAEEERQRDLERAKA
jgi:hypothetical protein